MNRTTGLTLTRLLMGVFLLPLSMGQSLLAQNEAVLHSFGGYGDGIYPMAGLVLDKQGNLYGTTSRGGTFAGGTIFELSPAGSETLLWAFGSEKDGYGSIAPLAIDKLGHLFGTTQLGGANFEGTVFEVPSYQEEQVLYSFENSGIKDGIQPFGGLLVNSQGVAFGTTVGGGTASCKCGTIFKWKPPNTETVLHSFTDAPDGNQPFAGLVKFRGSYFGTTHQGGGGSCSNGCGTVFKITTNGKEKVLYRFAGGNDGSQPGYGALVADKQGNLYGTTIYGGLSGKGVVFELSPTGEQQTLYSFNGAADGGNPAGGLIMDKEGNLYGMTSSGGGSCSCGTVFELTPAGTFVVLHAFSGSDGKYPQGTLIMDKKGNLFGTTNEGGDFGYGTVFMVKGAGGPAMKPSRF
jgi:uncharacterized repeat protein (TIGR03803 family)